MAIVVVNTGNSNPANVRWLKDTGSRLVGTIDNGTGVNVVRVDGTWASLQLNGETCFMQHRMLPVGMPTTIGAGLDATTYNKAKCCGDDVTVRPTASTANTGVGVLNRGDDVTIYEASTVSGYVWYRIGTGRWVRGDLLAPNPVGSSSGGSGSTTPGTTAAPTLAQVREGTHYFKVGDYGTSVTSLRALVQAKSITCGSGNVYDETLKNAILTFQQRHSILRNDGLCGQGTLAILEDDENMSGWFNESATSNRCRLTAGKLIKIGFTGSHILKPSIVSLLNEMINDSRFKFTTKVQVRHLLAQARAEIGVGEWSQFTEGSYAEGSTTKYNGYFGSGMLQLTHDYNYRDFKAALYPTNTSIYPNPGYAPHYVARNYPFISAGWYWQYSRSLNTKLAPGGTYYSLSADETVKRVTDDVKGATGTYPARATLYANIKSILL